MKPAPVPILAKPATMARLLDMTQKELSGLVEAGELPPPRMVGKCARYDVEQVRRALAGETLSDAGAMAWPGA